MLNCVYFLIDSLGMIVIDFFGGYILLFTEQDIFSFFSTLILYTQGVAITVWLPIKINGFLIRGVGCLEYEPLDYNHFEFLSNFHIL